MHACFRKGRVGKAFKTKWTKPRGNKNFATNPALRLSTIASDGRPCRRLGVLEKFCCHSLVGVTLVSAAQELGRAKIFVAIRNCLLNIWHDHGLHSRTDIAKTILRFIRDIVTDQSSPSNLTHPTIKRSIFRCSLSTNWYSDFVKGKVAKPNKIAGETTASKSFKRNCRAICLFVKIYLCLWKFIQPIWNLCCSSTKPRRFKCPQIVRPRYLCLSSPHNTAKKSSQPSMYKGCSKYEVVNNFVLEVFSCKPARLSSTTNNSNISTSSSRSWSAEVTVVVQMIGRHAAARTDTRLMPKGHPRIYPIHHKSWSFDHSCNRPLPRRKARSQREANRRVWEMAVAAAEWLSATVERCFSKKPLGLPPSCETKKLQFRAPEGARRSPDCPWAYNFFRFFFVFCFCELHGVIFLFGFGFCWFFFCFWCFFDDFVFFFWVEAFLGFRFTHSCNVGGQRHG